MAGEDQDEKLSRAKRKIRAAKLEEARPIAERLLFIAGDMKIARTFASGMRLPDEVHTCLDEFERAQVEEKKPE